MFFVFFDNATWWGSGQWLAEICEADPRVVYRIQDRHSEIFFVMVDASSHLLVQIHPTITVGTFAGSVIIYVCLACHCIQSVYFAVFFDSIRRCIRFS
jgi:hypothetical protein